MIIIDRYGSITNAFIFLIMTNHISYGHIIFSINTKEGDISILACYSHSWRSVYCQTQRYPKNLKNHSISPLF